MKGPIRVGLFLLISSLALTACRNASRDDKITARDDASFDAWINNHRRVLTPAEATELNTARQQIRYKVMQGRPGLVGGEFAHAVYAEIDGRTPHELLLTSYTLQIERMKVELLNYQPQLERFRAHQQNRSLSAEQKTVVAEGLEKLQRAMSEHQVELARLTQRLSELERATTTVAK